MMKNKPILVVVNTDSTLEENEVIKKTLLQYIDIISEKSPMNLTRLDRIILTQYFDYQLEHLSLFTNRKIVYTNNDNSQAIAKCITLREGTEFIDILVLSEFFLGIMIKDPNMALHILHHELVHIFDRLIRDDVLYHFNREQIYGPELYSLPTAMSAWDEFFANYYSVSTLTEDTLKNTIDNFHVNLISLEKNVVEKHQLYRIGEIDLDTFLNKYFLVYTNSLYLAAAYTIGSCFGIKRSLEIVDPEVYRILKEHMFLKIFIDMETILVDMLNKYPESWDESIYDLLNENILNFYKKLGVSFREDIDENGEAGIWVDVF